MAKGSGIDTFLHLDGMLLSLRVTQVGYTFFSIYLIRRETQLYLEIKYNIKKKNEFNVISLVVYLIQIFIIQKNSFFFKFKL